MVASSIDSLVLGCTHYPYLIPQIRKIVGPQLQIIDSGEAVAKQTKAILNEHHLANSTENKTPQHLIYTNKETVVLEELLLNSMQPNIKILKC
jgi:glutamate racemase